MTSTTEPAALALAPSLDLTAAEDLCQVLRTQLSQGDIVLDGAQVENISTPCLQVLAAAAAGARDLRRAFRLLAPSATLRAAIADLGFHAAIPTED